MIEYIFSVLIVLVVVVAYKCVVAPKRLHKNYLQTLQKKGYLVHQVPFQPFGLPFFRIIQQNAKQGDPFKTIKTVHSGYDVTIMNFFNKVLIEFSHPDFIKAYYTNQHVYTYPKVQLLIRGIYQIMGKGVPFSQGSQWQRKRRIINTVFNFDFIKSSTGKIQKLCDKAIKDVEQTAIHSEQDQQHIIQFDIINLTVRIFSSVILQCFLGGATEQKLEGKPICLFISQLIGDITTQSADPLSILFGPNILNLGLRAKDRDLKRKIKLFKSWGIEYIKQKIRAAKQKFDNDSKAKPTNIIQALVEYNSRPQNKDQKFYSQKQILEEFATFFVAGTDTTSHYLMTMIYYIAQNNHVQVKLREQISQYMANDDYSYQNLKNFTYLEWVQKQTTRIYGPINGLFFRQAQKDNYLNGVLIKKGTYILIQHMGNHYSKKYFLDPFVFRPERWEKQCDEIPPFVLGGFGAGPRTCLGKHLALLQSKIGLIKFLKRYKKITVPQGPLKMTLRFVYTPEYFTSKMVIKE